MSAKASRSYYARVLGTFWRHPRTATISLAACGAWVRCLSWCADHRTDGAIPRAVIPMVLGGRDDRRAIAELVSSGLLVEVGDALHVRDWSQHNITREQHEQKLESLRNRVARSRGNDETPPAASHGNASAPAPVSGQVTAHVTRYTPRTDGGGTPLPSDQDQDQDQRSSSASDARARSPAGILSADAETVRTALSDAVKRHRSVAPGRDLALGTGPSATVLDVARWCREEASRSGREFTAVARELADRWARARDGQGRWVPLGWLARDPTEWATAAASDVSVPETEAERDADVDEIMRRCAWVPGQSEEVTHG